MTQQKLSFDDSAAYDRFMGCWSRAVGPAFLDWLAPPPNARWLEVGCGTGIFTELILDRCSPAAVSAIDPSAEQVAHANRQVAAQQVEFQVADAQSLPFPDASFDVVASALTLNFIPDRARGLAEMQRVARAGGSVSAYIWDFTNERSPSSPMRMAMKEFGMAVPDIPGTEASGFDALAAMFQHAGLEDITTNAFEVTVPFSDFNAYWEAQTPSYAPWTRMIAKLSNGERDRLVASVRAGLPIRADGTIAYASRAHAIRARAPGGR